MKSYDLDGVSLELTRGDITRQDDMGAVVNAANEQLMPGGGVAGAIHRAAGPELAEACRPLAPIRPGEAVATDAFGLPNDYVIHCLGPVYGADEPSDRLLADCYRNAIALAREKGVTSLAFPALSTGAFGYPVEEAAGVALAAVREVVAGTGGPKTVRFVLFGQGDLDAHVEAAERLLG